ncbi:MAG: hypothetical protein LBH59_07905 [Planctomycetaceae bacterium]|nr:hypothetical protein [Planctomycetaceae bacterium]
MPKFLTPFPPIQWAQSLPPSNEHKKFKSTKTRESYTEAGMGEAYRPYRLRYLYIFFNSDEAVLKSGS